MSDRSGCLLNQMFVVGLTRILGRPQSSLRLVPALHFAESFTLLLFCSNLLVMLQVLSLSCF